MKGIFSNIVAKQNKDNAAYEQWETDLDESAYNYLGESDTGYYTESLEQRFESFKARNPHYLVDLDACIKDLYSLYDIISRKRYAKLNNNETIFRLGFGMLMRHALEAISVDLMIRNKIEAADKTVSERLGRLEGQIIPEYSKETARVLYTALNLTNEIAHPYVTTDVHTYEELCKFYKERFEPVILRYMGMASKRRIRKYLAALHKRMNHFSVKDAITRTLILGCLVRQLTECAVNRWSYSKGLVPTEGSTRENQFGISQRLHDLNQKFQQEGTNPSGSAAAFDKKTIHSLYAMKGVSNCLMHVAPDNIKLSFLKQKGKELKRLYFDVVTQCSPGALTLKFDSSARKWKTFWATLLCGLFGWTGAHHFYAGNIGKGVACLILYGILIGPTLGGYMEGSAAFTTFLLGLGPIISLMALSSGEFRTRRWGILYKTGFSSFLCKVFTVLQLIVLYLLLWGK